MKYESEYEREVMTGDSWNEAALTDEQKAVVGKIQALETEMQARRKDPKYTNQENRDYEQEKLDNLKTLFFDANETVREGLERELEKHKEKLRAEKEKRADRDSLELKRAELEYSGYSKAEIEAEAMGYATNPDDPKWTHDRLLVLNSFVGKHGISKVPGGTKGATNKTFREWMDHHRARDEWLRTDEGRALDKAIKLYASHFGYANILNVYGKVEELDLDKIYKRS